MKQLIFTITTTINSLQLVIPKLISLIRIIAFYFSLSYTVFS